MDQDLTEQLSLCSNQLPLVDQQKAETLCRPDACTLASSPSPSPSSSKRSDEARESCSVAEEPGSSHRQQEASGNFTVDAQELQIGVFGQDKTGVISRTDFCNLKSLLDAQRDRILEQLQQLERVVVLQCRITETNPLAQEMGSVVLGKRVGKFGDYLTPKALKCLYNVFSIKDTITKKEAREISGLCGATVTQVREFFAGQRSRVRKVVHFSHIDEGSDQSSLRMQPAQLEQPASMGLQHGLDPSLASSQQVASNQINHLVLLNTFCGKSDGISSKRYAVEKAEHLINVMHKEITFTGQSQLAQVIMQANDAVLRCFMARGGLQQIIRWLIQAATEEQTSLIRLILKAITRMTLGSASPRHMSLLLQTVNKLRFYRAQDVANRARLLLSRWSRFCKSTQGGKLSSSSARSSQLGQKRNRDCTHSSTPDDPSSKKAKAGNVSPLVDCKQTSDELLSPSPGDKNVQEREKSQSVSETVNPRKRLGGLLIQGNRAKEKRKVQLFEECHAASRRRDGEGTKPSSFDSPSRPLSADDIKKAKRRAYFLNNAKTVKHPSSKLDGALSLDLSMASLKRVQTPGNTGLCTAQQALSLSQDVFPGQFAGPVDVEATSRASSHVQTHESVEYQTLKESEPGSIVAGHSVRYVEESEMEMIPSTHWAVPERTALDPRWKIAIGDESTEVQSEIRRESTVLEAAYPSAHSIPSSSAEPAERLCLFVDDTLVPEILLESVDEESMERDCSLQSPRDAEPKEVHVSEADSHKLDAVWGNTHTDIPQSSLIDISVTMGLEIPIKDADMTAAKEDQQLLFSSAQSDGFNSVGKMNVFVDALNVCAISPPPTLTLASSMDHAFVDVRNVECPVADQGELTCNASFTQLKSVDANPLFEEQALFTTSTSKVSPSAISQAEQVKEEISSLAQSDRHSLQIAAPLTSRPGTPNCPDQMGASNSHINSSGVDLSELSKETCLDMLNIVLQQLADNAKGSGADLELLSVFLKNPQLVYSLMSAQSESGKGLPAATGGSLGESISNNVLGSLGYQLEELVGRNIGQVANSVQELASSGLSTGEIRQEIARSLPITGGGYESHPLVSSSLRGPHAPLEPINEPSNSKSKVIESSEHCFNRLPTVESSSSKGLDYDWSQPYDYPMQVGVGVSRRSLSLSAIKDRAANNDLYSQSSTGYTQAYPTRASQLSSSLLLADQRTQSSLSMRITGLGQASPSMMHTERQEERPTSRKNGFYALEPPVTHLLPNTFVRTAGISDGLLPVPDVAANNSRVYPGRVMHESQTVHGGTTPAFSAVNPAAVGHQLSHHLTNGAYHNEQNFKLPSLSSSHPTYVSNVRSTSPFVPSPVRPEGGLNIWRPPASYSSRPRHVRPGWRDG